MLEITNILILVSLICLFSNIASSKLTSSDINKSLPQNANYNIIYNYEHKKDDVIMFNEIPSPPFDLIALNITAISFQLGWHRPFVKVDGFLIQIIELGFNYYIPPLSCISPTKQPRVIYINYDYSIQYTIKDILPNQNIQVQMASYSTGIKGPWSIPINVLTLPKESDSVTDITVKFAKDKGIVIWKHPCFSNGNVLKFSLIAYGEHVSKYRKNPIFTTDVIKANLTVVQIQDEYQLEINLKAEYFYQLSIQTFIKEVANGGGYGVYKFDSPSQIPPEPAKFLRLNPQSKSPTLALIQLFRFEDLHGKILYYSVMIGEAGYISSTSGWMNSTNWPQEKTWQQVNQEDPIEEYQVTDIRWNPFKEHHQDTQFLIGANSGCRNIENASIYCNGPLRPDTDYGVILRAFTNRGYRDSQVFYFTTDRSGNPYLILLTMAIVAAIGSVVAFASMFVIKRRKKSQMKRIKQNKLNIDLGITADIDNNEPENLQLLDVDVINEEYKKLEKNTKKIHHHINIGSDACNKEKNRYCNVLPYDYNRVKLLGPDSGYYINASYIDGLGGANNFIATQGPKENTAVDFWKMVSSHKITIIIMLCKTIEQKKVKCHVYYPEDGQSNMYGDMRVCCIQRHSSKSYIVRDLILFTDGQELHLSHFQYLEWPDFGAPSSVKSLNKFCSIITKAEHPSNNSGPLVVHCSAGCGRTGTFIAIYHMLKMKPADVDIYEIVYKLRDKKMGMVQTKEQYIFLYKWLTYLKKTRGTN